MRKITFLAAVAATLCTVACNKNMDTQINEVPNPAEQEYHPLTIKIKGNAPETKATGIDPDDEVKVNTLQVIAFRDNVKDTYGSASNTDEITIQCGDGDRVVYAVVNGPDVSAINTPSDLLATVCTMDVTTLNNFAMVGYEAVSLPESDAVEIEVTRLASRIVVKKITRDFTVASEGAKTLKICGIYLGDAAIKNNLGGTYVPTATADFEFRGCVYSTEPDARALGGLISQVTLADDLSYSVAHTFYTFPNPTVADSAASTWNARHTHLIIQVLIDDTTKYYNIPLPVLERNKSYEIDEITLTRIGSSDPKNYLQDVNFELNVKNWTVVPVADPTY